MNKLVRIMFSAFLSADYLVLMLRVLRYPLCIWRIILNFS